MDYVVSGIDPAKMVTSYRRPGGKRNAHPLRGEVVEVNRESGGGHSRNRGDYNFFGYGSDSRGSDLQARITLKVRTSQDLSDLVGKLVVLTLAE